MKLPLVGQSFDPRIESQRNQILEQSDRMNRKRGQDIEVAGEERLILSSPNGTRWKITVSNLGVLTATSI